MLCPDIREAEGYPQKKFNVKLQETIDYITEIETLGAEIEGRLDEEYISVVK